MIDRDRALSQHDPDPGVRRMNSLGTASESVSSWGHSARRLDGSEELQSGAEELQSGAD